MAGHVLDVAFPLEMRLDRIHAETDHLAIALFEFALERGRGTGGFDYGLIAALDGRLHKYINLSTNIGYIKKGQGLVIHTHDCPTARHSRGDSDKWVDVEWDPDTDRMFDVSLRMVILDQRGVLAKVAAAIANAGCNIANVSVDEDHGMYATNQFTLQVANRQHLAKVLRSLRLIPEVVRITRVRD